MPSNPPGRPRRRSRLDYQLHGMGLDQRARRDAGRRQARPACRVRADLPARLPARAQRAADVRRWRL